jgi:hypothetical protein
MKKSEAFDSSLKKTFDECCEGEELKKEWDKKEYDKKWKQENAQYVSDYIRDWRKRNKDKIHLYNKDYHINHRETISAYFKRYYNTNRIGLRKNFKEWFAKNVEENKRKGNASHRKYHHINKMSALIKYSGNPPFCVCCGEKEVRFLTIDHINNDGKNHRKEIRGQIAVWLKKNNYPQGFQTLCFNCNCGKSINKGICPHKDIQKKK